MFCLCEFPWGLRCTRDRQSVLTTPLDYVTANQYQLITIVFIIPDSGTGREAPTHTANKLRKMDKARWEKWERVYPEKPASCCPHESAAVPR